MLDNIGFSLLDGKFEGKDPVWIQRRAIRDEYLKCWKRWTKLGESRKLFNISRHLFQVFEATRLWNDIETMYCDEFDVPRVRKLIVKRLQNVLKVICKKIVTKPTLRSYVLKCPTIEMCSRVYILTSRKRRLEGKKL